MAVCCMSAELRAQIRVNSEIERQLRVEHLQRRAQERRQVDLLLVGASGSGKSTFIQQIRLISGESDLRVRVPTTGVNECLFTINRVVFRLMKVETVSSTHRWLEMFDKLMALLFLVDTSDYDCLVEVDGQVVNKLQKSLDMFVSVVSCKQLKCEGAIVIFNKMDKFEEKIKVSNLATYFPDYSGPEKDVSEAKSFIASMFTKTIPPTSTVKGYSFCLFASTIEAKPAGLASQVFNCIKDIVLARDIASVMQI